jgi:hypothetical protein
MSRLGLFWGMDCDMDFIPIHANPELDWCKQTRPYMGAFGTGSALFVFVLKF